MRTRNSITTKPIIRSNHHHRWREGLLIIVAAFSIFLLLALITFHRNHLIRIDELHPAKFQDAVGRVGTVLSELLFYLFGFIAYLFPVLLSYGAWLSCRVAKEDNDNRQFNLLRVIGFITIIVSSCGLLNLEISHFYGGLTFYTGGALGHIVSIGLVSIVNRVGAIVLLFGLFLSGITLFTGFSWMNVIHVTGYLTLLALSGLASLWAIWRTKRSSAEIIKPIKSVLDVQEPILSLNDAESPRKQNKSTRIEPQIQAVNTLRFEHSIENESTPLTSLLDNQATLNHGKPKKETPAHNTKIFNKVKISGDLPSLNLLDPPERNITKSYSNAMLEQMSREVEMRLMDFGITVQVVAVHPGPVVTRFELQLAAGLKVSKVTGLVKDLARSLSVPSVRIVEVIPGKSVIGLELPNEHRQIVRLSEVLISEQYEQARSPLSLALGKDIAGHPVVVDLAKMPHLLVAGTTGAGKSVGLNAMLLSLLYKASPQEVRMIMIDPKMLELSIYEGIPHLLTPVVTDMKEAANALRWCVSEMDRRYKLMAALGVRNLAGYNAKVEEAEKAGEPLNDPFWQPQLSLDEEPVKLCTLPYIVVLVDEFADMMMVVGKKVEELIARIAQKARAAGIHLILATQRPSVDVITGLIKANIPTRIAFQVSSKIDSRTILDQQGAEQLLGHGDMLYLAPGTGVPVRVHGAFVADQEVHKVVDDWKHRGEPEYLIEILETKPEPGEGIDGEDGEDGGEQDPLYDQAVQIVIETRRASISSVQRRLKIGYNRAARLIEEMERAGLVSPMESNGSREVLVPTAND